MSRRGLNGTEGEKDTAWYAVYCNGQRKASQAPVANDMLKQAGYETLFLHYVENGIIRSLYHKYLFVAVGENQGLHGVLRTPGVHSVVTFGGEPAEMPAEVIEKLRLKGDASGLCILSKKEKQLRKRLRNGTKVKYKPDPFTEWFGSVRLDSGSAVSMWINEKKVTAPSHHVFPIVAER